MNAIGSIICLLLLVAALAIGAYFDGLPGFAAGLFWAGFFCFLGGCFATSGPVASAVACVLAFVFYIVSFFVCFVIEYVVCANASSKANLSAFYSTRYLRNVADAPVWLVSTVSGKQDIGLSETVLVFGVGAVALLLVCIVAVPRK